MAAALPSDFEAESFERSNCLASRNAWEAKA